MNSIVYIGMDVHKESYTVCSYTIEKETIEHQQKLPSDYKMVLKYVEKMRKIYGRETEFICGYEAGFLGYSLYHALTARGITCIILAPTTMAVEKTKRIKTDKRDAANIAKCLAYNTYSPVYILDKEDNAIKDYIRMRDDKKQMLKKTKQQLLAFVVRQGKVYTESGNWTKGHLKWLRTVALDALNRETLDEYMATYDYLEAKIERLDERIAELASGARYQENVKNLNCFLGIKTHTALSVLVEVGDFERFESAGKFASYLGLVPGEASSGERVKRYHITKAGNQHIRRLLVESAQGYTRGAIGYKSKAIRKRQQGASPAVIAYADKASERLRRRFYKLTLQKGKKHNVAKTAIARELACFIWGMMTGRIT